MIIRRFIFTFWVMVITALPPAAAAKLSIGLTTSQVNVDADFSGAEIVLFGAIDEDLVPMSDLVAIVKGPSISFVVRPIVKTGLIWAPGDAIDLVDAPGLYLTNATRPLESFTNPPVRQEAELDAASLNLAEKIADETASDEAKEIVEAFVRSESLAGRYQDNIGAVSFKDGGLFTIDIALPPNTPVGDYAVDVFLFRDGQIIAADTAALSVNKVGLERRIYNLAHERPLGYGVICVALSLFAGWLAAFAMRK